MRQNFISRILSDEGVPVGSQRVNSVVLLVDWKKDGEFWLQEELIKLGWNVTLLDIQRYSIRNRQSRWRKILLWIQFLSLGWRGNFLAHKMKPKGVVVAWNFIPGALGALFGFRSVPTICLNLIYLDKGQLHSYLRKKIYEKALSNPNTLITCASEEIRQRICSDYHVQQDHAFVLADPWHSWYQKELPCRQDGGYCFCGGEAARDWKTFVDVARSCPSIPFKAVARRIDWHEEYTSPNLEWHFDVPQDVFYRLVANARIVLIPLKSSMTVGLTVFIRSVLLGRPVITTHTPGLEQYYPSDCKDMLVPMFAWREMATLCQTYWHNETLRMAKTNSLARKVTESFSPVIYSEKLDKIINHALTTRNG
jgi:hypothetical protein